MSKNTRYTLFTSKTIDQIKKLEVKEHLLNINLLRYSNVIFYYEVKAERMI